MFNRDEIRERLTFAISPWWQDIREMKNIQDRAADELALFVTEYYRYVDGRSILTADSEKLIKWEVMYGIVVNLNKPLEERRSVVLAKHRGLGTVTIPMIKNTAESWYNGIVEVSEGGGAVSVKFTSNVGAPSNAADVRKALREIIPAHLMLNMLYMYLLIRDIEGVQTLSQMEGITLDKFAGGA